MFRLPVALLPRAGRVRLLFCALLSVCALGLIATPQVVADPGLSTQSASALALPSDALSGGYWSLNGIACATTDSCVAVGQYENTSSDSEAYVTPITDGVPGSPVVVTLPANANTAGLQAASLQGVACQSDDLCEAYGYYLDSSHQQQWMVIQLTNGLPAQAVELTPPADAVTASITLNAISCAAVGACVVVGTYRTASAPSLPLVVTISGGDPGAAVAPSLPTDSNTTANAQLSSVACQSASSCVAVGGYYDASDDYTTLLVPITDGAVGAGVATLPADAAANPDASLEEVACPTSGSCEAIGSYYNSSGNDENMVVPISDGTPGTAIAVTPAASAEPADPVVTVQGLSCSSASLCVAAGFYYNTASDPTAALTLITGNGAASQPVSLPSDASQTFPYSEFEAAVGSSAVSSSAVSCAPSGPCLATGWYYTTAGGGADPSGLEAQVSASGQVGAGEVAPVPSDAADPQNAELFVGTSCDAAGSCVSIGVYGNNAVHFGPYEVTEQAPLSVSTSSLSGGTVGSSYQATLAAAGAWGSYSWSVSSGSLPAGLTLDAKTGAISGTPTGSGTSTFTVEVTGTGSPLPTATEQLSIAVAPAAVTTTTTTTPTPTPTPTVVKPVVHLLSHSGLVKGNRLGVRLRCSAAACRGSVKVRMREVVTVKRGKKRVRKHRTVTIGSAGYSLAAGRARTLQVRLNAVGRKALVNARRHRVSVTIVATVRGGRQASRRETIWTASKKK